jgi:hypothetical protein
MQLYKSVALDPEAVEFSPYSQSDFSEINFNIILPYTPTSPKWFFPIS